MKKQHKYLLIGGAAVLLTPLALKSAGGLMGNASTSTNSGVTTASGFIDKVSGAATGAGIGAAINVGSKLLGFTPVGRVLTVAGAGVGWLLSRKPSANAVAVAKPNRVLKDGSVVSQEEYEKNYQGSENDTWQNGVTIVGAGSTGTW